MLLERLDSSKFNWRRFPKNGLEEKKGKGCKPALQREGLLKHAKGFLYGFVPGRHLEPNKREPYSFFLLSVETFIPGFRQNGQP